MIHFFKQSFFFLLEGKGTKKQLKMYTKEAEVYIGKSPLIQSKRIYEVKPVSTDNFSNLKLIQYYLPPPSLQKKKKKLWKFPN